MTCSRSEEDNPLATMVDSFSRENASRVVGWSFPGTGRLPPYGMFLQVTLEEPSCSFISCEESLCAVVFRSGSFPWGRDGKSGHA